ncbi:MAG TPA: 4-alpha-glucanotransferase, partial [Vulgatibacter sp.]
MPSSNGGGRRGPPTLHSRASGILLHPTSLPGPFGCGDLGPAADRFAAWLEAAGQRWWQMLPVGPVGYGNSPYSALSAFAGNPLLLSPERLAADGYDVGAPPPRFPDDRVDFAAAIPWHRQMLEAAFRSWEGASDPRFDRFCREQAHWLDDWALFMALKEARGGRAWFEWEEPLRDRWPDALAAQRRALAPELVRHRFVQWLFDREWERLRATCAAHGVGLIGDLPIFVAHDSADVWAHRELFFVDGRGQPSVVAGVPPDYFSRSGQRWGNPLYRWDALRESGYAWWLERLRQVLHRFDAIRLDHFIGFTRYWEIPGQDETAERGRWLPGPGDDFFRAAHDALGELPLIAEDLGAVTPEVTALRDRFGLPGIRILQFAFGTDPQAPDFLPHNYPRNAVVYTGTHDNDTVEGWYRDPGGPGSQRTPQQAEKERRAAERYLGMEGCSPHPGARVDGMHWAMIRAVLASV